MVETTYSVNHCRLPWKTPTGVEEALGTIITVSQEAGGEVFSVTCKVVWGVRKPNSRRTSNLCRDLFVVAPATLPPEVSASWLGYWIPLRKRSRKGKWRVTALGYRWHNSVSRLANRIPVTPDVDPDVSSIEKWLEQCLDAALRTTD